MTFENITYNFNQTINDKKQNVTQKISDKRQNFTERKNSVN